MKTLNYTECLGLMAQLANKIACFREYKSWSKDFCHEEANGIFERQAEKYNIDPTQLTKPELVNLGACVWSEDSNLMLLPIWMNPFLIKGLVLECISGEKVTVGVDEYDNDIRFGCIAWGVTPKGDDHAA